MSDGSSILLTVVSTTVGSVASWFFSRWYYHRSGDDLDIALRPLAGDNQKQLRALTALARMLEQGNIGKPSYDEAGNLTGVVITGTVHMTTSSFLKASGTISPPPQYDRQHEQPQPDKQDSVDA